MEYIFIPASGILAAGSLGFICLLIPQLRRFIVAALAAPFVTSIVLLFGCFILADMNPAREYGAAYIPTGKEHDPTRLDYWLLLLVLIATVALSSVVAYGAQWLIVTQAQHALAERPLGMWLSERRWFRLAK